VERSDLFPGRLREYRKAAGLTQAELAKAAGVDSVHVSRMERGERVPGIDTACKLAAALRCSVCDLLVSGKRRKK
jgi:putative transcriptional regulator